MTRTRLAAFLLVAAGCGTSPREVFFDAAIVQWSHDCRSLTCSGSGTDLCDPAVDASVDCEWRCALYQDELLHVRARFAFSASGCLEDPVVITGACE